MKKLFILSLAAGFVLLPASPVWAQGRYSLAWLRSPHVQKELEIVDYQLDQINELQADLQKQTGEIYAEIRKLPREEQGEKYREAHADVQELHAKMEKKLSKILLPQQVERLRQVSVQMQMRGGASNGLRGELAEQLGITEEQQQQLREKAAAKNKELFEKYAELRAKMEEELLEEVLSDKQRKKLDALLGEPVDFAKWHGAVGGRRPAGGAQKKQ